MSSNIIEEKSFQFSIDIVHLYEKLCEERREYILSKQFLRSGTGIGVNIKEALIGRSKRDFLSKMNIALKEANEAEYWIELLISTGYINKEKPILCKCKELCKILNSIVKTTKNNRELLIVN